MRSALILSWVALSSPEIYRTLRDLMDRIFCNTSVDFPMPGSPPSRISEPGTTPPPNTLLSSFDGNGMRCCSVASMSLIFWTWLRPASVGPMFFEGLAAIFSSTRVFHSPQAGQRPSHRGSRLHSYCSTRWFLSWSLPCVGIFGVLD